MAEQEGVIKYQLIHRDAQLPAEIDVAEINGWRWLLYQLALIGQHPEKYDGLGYGNLSRRLHPGQPQFLISGTQTGHFEHLDRCHFAIVEAADPLSNRLLSSGPMPPSSEALTHASVYRAHPAAQAVIHVHSPLLWRNTDTLGLPHSAGDIRYGTVEMALAVESLLDSERCRQIAVFSMLGHQDGIVAFGSDLAAAVQLLMIQLSRAVAIEQGRMDR